jgi:hypothetical protein
LQAVRLRGVGGEHVEAARVANDGDSLPNGLSQLRRCEVRRRRLGGRFIVVTQHRWRVNLRGGADIEITHAGQRRTMHADLDEKTASVAATLHTLIQQLGWPTTQRQTGLTYSEPRAPTLAELQEAVRRYHLATITLSTS